MCPLFRGQACGGCILMINADMTPSPQSRLPRGRPSRDGLFRAPRATVRPVRSPSVSTRVAEVRDMQSHSELQTLRYELETFVCEGQYATGLARILGSYLQNLDRPEQPAVWVGGFFGSGKSHLVKMLRSLWVDFEFPDKATARGIAKLPTDITDLLREL